MVASRGIEPRLIAYRATFLSDRRTGNGSLGGNRTPIVRLSGACVGYKPTALPLCYETKLVVKRGIEPLLTGLQPDALPS
jgi:hypothetical protein